MKNNKSLSLTFASQRRIAMYANIANESLALGAYFIFVNVQLRVFASIVAEFFQELLRILTAAAKNWQFVHYWYEYKRIY
jgi:hypothetical protein